MKAFFRNRRNSPGVKLGVFALSLLISVAVLEGGLRLAGLVLASGRKNVFTAPYAEGGHDADFTFERYQAGRGPLILTFGDSLVNGNNVASYHSFPYNLYKRYKDKGGAATVYNLGKCEESTLGVAAKIENYFKEGQGTPKPDAIVILVGAADLFNLPLARERMLSEGGVWHDVLPTGWAYSSRIYKVFRYIRTNLTLRGGLRSPESDKSTEEKFDLLLRVYREHKQDARKTQNLRLGRAHAQALAPVFAGEAGRYRLDLDNIGDVAELLTDYAGRVYTPQLRFDDYFELLSDIAETFPVGFWTGEFDGANYQYVQIYQVQSKFTPAEVLASLNRAAAAHPELNDSEGFLYFRKILTDREEVGRFVDRQRLETWERIVAIARARGVALVLQNYPVEYKSANRIIDQVAEKYDLPLIDNRRFFGALIEKEGRGPYLEDNDHLTPLGNERLAENAYETLRRVIP